MYIPSHVGKCLNELKAEQDHTKEILGNEYKDYNLVLATTFGMPIGASHVRTKMKQIIKKEGLPDVVFHSLRHTSVTYKLFSEVADVYGDGALGSVGLILPDALIDIARVKDLTGVFHEEPEDIVLGRREGGGLAVHGDGLAGIVHAYAADGEAALPYLRRAEHRIAPHQPLAVGQAHRDA